MRSDNDELNETKIPFTSREVRYQFIADLIHWMLSSKFSSFTVFISIVFILLTFIFALIIMAIAQAEPKCVTSTVFYTNNGFEAGFNDALSLSWTTFTTVGYGVISPSTSASFQNDMDRFDKSGGCVMMSVLLSFESLVGILFVSYAGAIMYVKLIQFQSNAQVAFSSVLLVKYGRGVDAEDVDDDMSVSTENGETELQMAQKMVPFPVLVFRMVNLLNSTKNGEIVDAQVNTVATVNLKNAVMRHITRGNTVYKNALNTEITQKVSGKRVYSYIFKPERSISAERTLSSFINNVSTRRRNKSNQSNRTTSTRSSSNNSEKSEMSYSSNAKDISSSRRASIRVKNTLFQIGMTQEQIDLTEDDLLENVKSEGHHDFLNDDHSNDFVSPTVRPLQSINLYPAVLENCTIHKETQVEMPNMVFTKVAMDPVHHPYFRSSWRVLHTLNQESPLLTKEVRKKITDNGGSWPAELNKEEAIRDSIDFDQFLVSFKGLSKSTGTKVYSHQVYTKEAIRVGYQFKSILVSNPDGSLGIVPEDIDQIEPQHGGIL